MSTCYIVSGGDFDEDVQIGLQTGDFVIACDSGYENARRLGLPVNLLVGDFDSLTGTLPADVPTYRAPVRKDDTDTMLAARIAVERGCNRVTIVCALGGRLDHTLANLQTLAFLCEQNVMAEIYAGETRVWAVQNDTLELAPIAGFGLSVFAWSGACSGVYLRGLSYPLTNATVTPTFPIGVSNRFTAEPARITVGDGMLMVMACRA